MDEDDVVALFVKCGTLIVCIAIISVLLYNIVDRHLEGHTKTITNCTSTVVPTK